MAAGGLADLRTSLEQGLGLPVSHPTLEILLNEQAELKVSPVMQTQVPCASSCNMSPPLYPSFYVYAHTSCTALCDLLLHLFRPTAKPGLALDGCVCI